MKLLEIVRGKQSSPDGDRDLDGPGEEAGQGRRAGRQLPGVRRQPHVRPLHPRGPVPGRGRGDDRGGRCRADRRSAWRWARWRSSTWPAWTWAGGSARKAAFVEPPGRKAFRAEDRLCELGHFGQKTGAGWYRYEAGSRHADAEPGGRAARRGGRPRSRDRAADDRRRRRSSSGRSTPSSTKGARSSKRASPCGPATSTSSTSTATASPPYRGGPMWYADTVGLKTVYDRIRQFEQQHGSLVGAGPAADAARRDGQDVRGVRRGEGRP